MAVFRPTIWRWISGILGVTCLLLMAVLIVLKNLFPKLSIEPTIFPGSTLKIQEDFKHGPCQERWIGYQCNCYYISSDFKMWNESIDFCASQNSTLLQMHNRDELHFMKLNPYFYWIGVTYSAKDDAWVWLNGSSVSQDILSISKPENPVNCIAYSSRLGALYETCIKKNFYICKR